MGNGNGKRVAVACLGIAMLLAAPGVLSAAGFSPASVDYSADRYMTGGGQTMTAKVYSSPGKERLEMNGGEHVTIVRMDKKVSWVLMPTQQMYMEQRFGQGKAQRGREYWDCDVRQKDAGKEEVNGVRTRKLTIDVSCPDRSRYHGTLWLSKENIPMRMETVDPSDKSVFRMELRNLKIAKQDPRLFELPAGYRRFEMPSMGNMDPQHMMERQPQAAAPPPPPPEPESAAAPGAEEAAAPEAPQPQEKSTVDKVLDPAKKLKNLFHW